MEHHLLTPLYDLILKERPQSEKEFSAANLVGLRLLQGPYLGETYRSWGLYEDKSGRFVLAQAEKDGIVTRDVFEPFHHSPYDYGYEDEYEDGAVQDFYRVATIPKAAYKGELIPGEEGLAQDIRKLADEMMDRLRLRFPSAVALFMEPTASQIAKRYEITVERLTNTGFGDHLRPIIGDAGDWSLSAYGIKYHNPSYRYNDDVYFFAHNKSEVCAVMCLGGGRDWGYGVRYVCVSPGFQNRGLSKKLYQAALDLCAKEKKVLLRTKPGDGTPPQATIAYDRLVKSSPVLHTLQSSPLAYLVEKALEKGWDYDDLVEVMKPVCDDDILPESFRLEGRTEATWEETQKFRETHAPVMDRILKGPSPVRPKRPRP